MFKRVHAILALVVKFLRVNWQSKHVIIGVFETNEITKHGLVKNLIELFYPYCFFLKSTYVKDEESNINNMNDVLKLVVNCEALGLEESYKGTCF